MVNEQWTMDRCHTLHVGTTACGERECCLDQTGSSSLSPACVPLCVHCAFHCPPLRPSTCRDEVSWPGLPYNLMPICTATHGQRTTRTHQIPAACPQCQGPYPIPLVRFHQRVLALRGTDDGAFRHYGTRARLAQDRLSPLRWEHLFHSDI